MSIEELLKIGMVYFVDNNEYVATWLGAEIVREATPLRAVFKLENWCRENGITPSGRMLNADEQH